MRNRGDNSPSFSEADVGFLVILQDLVMFGNVQQRSAAVVSQPGRGGNLPAVIIRKVCVTLLVCSFVGLKGKMPTPGSLGWGQEYPHHKDVSPQGHRA